MALQSINLYYSYLDSFEMLGDAEVGRLIKGAITYARDGAEPEFRGNERFVWPVLRGQISRDQEAYEAKCAKQRDNIAKRWAKDTTVYDGTSGIPSDTKHTKNKDKDKDKDKDNTPKAPKGHAVGADFDLFWKAYPKKVGKEAARKAFAKVRVPVETLIKAVEGQKRMPQWLKEDGQFIPHPATWLNQGRWMDEAPLNPKDDPNSIFLRAMLKNSKSERGIDND